MSESGWDKLVREGDEARELSPNGSHEPDMGEAAQINILKDELAKALRHIDWIGRDIRESVDEVVKLQANINRRYESLIGKDRKDG